jgi:hypothetical protein
MLCQLFGTQVQHIVFLVELQQLIYVQSDTAFSSEGSTLRSRQTYQ